jgi:ribose transport system permease protein
LVTTAIGFIQGFIKSKSQVPSFILTLGGQAIITGGAMLITTKTIGVTEGYEVVGWMFDRTFGIPNSFLISIFIILVIGFLIKKTPFGRYVYAIGLSESTALMSGIKVEKIRIAIYTFAGFIAGITGALMVARSHSGNYNALNDLLTPSIAAVVIGGTSITGGFGSLTRTFIGSLSITVMRVGIAMIGVDPSIEPLAYGIMIIIAVSMTIDRERIKIVK